MECSPTLADGSSLPTEEVTPPYGSTGIPDSINARESLGAQNSCRAAEEQQLLGQWQLVLKPLAIISHQSCWIIKAPLQVSATAPARSLSDPHRQCCCSLAWASSSQPHWNATHGTKICFVAASEHHYRHGTSHPQRWSCQDWCAMRGTHTFLPVKKKNQKPEFLSVHPSAKALLADFPSLGVSAIYLWSGWVSGCCNKRGKSLLLL